MFDALCRCIYSLPGRGKRKKASSNLKAFADNNFIVAQMEENYFDRVEDIVGKGKNAGYQWVFFFLFPQCFFLSVHFRDYQKSEMSGEGIESIILSSNKDLNCELLF